VQLNFWASGGPRGFEMASLHESLEALGNAFIAFGQVLNFLYKIAVLDSILFLLRESCFLFVDGK
jgi:hypothetical protein